MPGASAPGFFYMPRQKSVILLTANEPEGKLTPDRKGELETALEELEHQAEIEREAHEKEVNKLAARKQLLKDQLKKGAK